MLREAECIGRDVYRRTQSRSVNIAREIIECCQRGNAMIIVVKRCELYVVAFRRCSALAPRCISKEH